MRRLVALALVLAFAPALARAEDEAGPDTIKLKVGRAMSGVRVEKETLKEVVYRISGSKQNVAYAEVAEIVYGGAPVPYTQALAQMAAGNYEKAVELLKKVADLDEPAWLKPYANVKLGEALRLSGDLAAALGVFEKLVKEFPEHPKVIEALFGLGAAAQAQESTLPKAEEAFKQLASGKYGDVPTLKGKFGLGAVLLARKKFAEALDAFDDVSGEARRGRGAEMQAVWHQAELGKGNAQLGQQKFDAAHATFNELLRAPQMSPEVAASAWNGLGEATTALQKNEGGRKKALLAHLRAVIIYASVREEYARGLFRAAELFKALEQPQRAKELLAELRTRCPGSRWAGMAD